MAKVYSAPIPAPEFSEYEDHNGRIDFNKMNEVDSAYFARLTELAKANGPGDLVGEVLRFPHADGYAVYMVWTQKPLSLIHLSLHDGYAIAEAHERGLKLSDVRAQVNRDKRLAELFGRKS